MDVKHLAKLANLQFSDDKLASLKSQIEATFDYVNTLQATDTKDIPETNQVTGLESVLREDRVDEQRMLTQQQALSGAKNTHQGYFVVPAILE